MHISQSLPILSIGVYDIGQTFDAREDIELVAELSDRKLMTLGYLNKKDLHKNGMNFHDIWGFFTSILLCFQV
jgi:hypothetical protein